MCQPAKGAFLFPNTNRTLWGCICVSAVFLLFSTSKVVSSSSSPGLTADLLWHEEGEEQEENLLLKIWLSPKNFLLFGTPPLAYPNSPNPFHFQMPCGLFIGSRGGRNLSVFSHLYTGLGHSSEYSPLSLLAFLGLLFLRFITHVTDFRSLQSQGFRNMRPFQNYRCEAEGFEPDICSSFMGLNEIAALGD